MSYVTFNQETKDHWIKVMQEHQDADRLIKGTWILKGTDHEQGQPLRGCFFGCAMQTSDDPLGAAIKSMNLPAPLVYLLEKIYEGLPTEASMSFPVDALSAIPVDTDIEHVFHEIAILRLETLIKNNPTVGGHIQLVVDCHKNWRDYPDWSAALSAALSAAESALSAAAESAGLSAAESVLSAALSAESVLSAALSARSADLSAAESVLSAALSAESVLSAALSARSAALSDAWSVERDNLITALLSCS